MQLILRIALPLMFALGQWQLVEKVYFAHVALLFLLIVGSLAHCANTAFTLPKSLIGWSLIFVLSTIFATWSALNLEALRASTQLLLFVLSVMLPSLLVLDEQSIFALLYAILAGAAFNAVAGLVQSVIWISNYGFVLIAEGEWFRVTGVAVTPTDYVMQLIIGLALSGMLTNLKLRNLARSLFIVCLLFSNSRSALIVLVFFGFYQFSSAGLRTIFLTATLIFIALMLSSISDAGQLVLSRFADIFNFDFNVKRVVTFENISQRIFAETEHLLIGHGYGMYEFFHPIDLEVYNNPHNIYLYVLFSGGVLGFVTFFGLIAYLLQATRNLKQLAKNSPQLTCLARSINFLHINVLLIGLVETNIVGIGSGWTTGMCFGCALAANRFIRSCQQNSISSSRAFIRRNIS